MSFFKVSPLEEEDVEDMAEDLIDLEAPSEDIESNLRESIYLNIPPFHHQIT